MQALNPQADGPKCLGAAVSDQERELIDALPHHPGFEGTPEYLLEGWQRFIEHVEEGYNDLVDEFVHTVSRTETLLRTRYP